MIGLPLAAVLAFLLYLVAWFHAGVLYSGDGTYRRYAGETTFQVAFPPIDLTRPGRYSFRFTRLAPPMHYTVGFRVPERTGLDAQVSMQLQNERGEMVFRHARRLSEWNWLQDRATIDGAITEVPIGGGSVRIERLGAGPDDGWGTHFTPRFSGTYTLTIVVERAGTSPAPLLAYPVIEAYTAGP
ncbi:MAG TPA: hypothetical protein VEO54_05745 [Thermoanaerobaculia bacterium]|nr:hypothetical protein [Thermoanaerobaculia bacterium]